MKGMWWNPLNNGEGFIFAEEGNRTYGYYFTHLGRTAVWYMLSLTENLQGYAGQVFRVETRINAVPGNPGHSHDNPPREISVGTCEILDQGDESFIIDLDINNDQIRYQIGSLFGTGFEAFGDWDFINPTPDPDPEPEPEPDPDPIGIPGLILEEYYANSWTPRSVPFTGTRVIHRPDTSQQQTCFQFKISAEPGYEFTITEAWVNGIADAEIEGPQVGDVIRPDGEHIIARLRAGPTNGQRLYPAWRISVNEGNVVDLVCRLSTG